MPTPIEQALISLVPTLNTLPDELLSLATALVSQSNAKASTLKPEEEIGRIYACAHIACEHLQSRLGLDKLQPRPPVPPRIYKKLHAFLTTALVPSTPRTKRFVDAVTPTSARTTTTPASRHSLATPTQTSPSKRPGGDETPSRRSSKRPRVSPVPESPPPPVHGEAATSALATAYDLPLEALRVAVAQHTPAIADDEEGVQLAGLVLAVAILQLTSSRARPLATAEFVRLRDRGLAAMGREADADVVASLKVWLRTAGAEGWVGRWKTAPTPLRRAEKHAPRPAGEVVEDEEDEGPLGRAGLVVGLGTMFQDAVDWLSVERRREYRAWEQDVRSRIAEIESR